MNDSPTSSDGRDAADAMRWEAVEEATELLHEERYHEALAQLRDVLASDPKNGYAYFYVGVCFYECGEMEPARDAYEACTRVAPLHLGARVSLAHVRRKLGDFRGAITEGLKALEISPGDGDALYAVGSAYAARGEDAAARKYLEAFLHTRPELEIRLEVEALLGRIGGGPVSADPSEDD